MAFLGVLFGSVADCWRYCGVVAVATVVVTTLLTGVTVVTLLVAVVDGELDAAGSFRLYRNLIILAGFDQLLIICEKRGLNLISLRCWR